MMFAYWINFWVITSNIFVYQSIKLRIMQIIIERYMCSMLLLLYVFV